MDYSDEGGILMHEWVQQGNCVAFTTVRGVLLDLDNMTFKKAKWITETLTKEYKLEGFLLVKSSAKSYHAVFNKYLSWKTITEVLFSRYECVRYAVQQIQNGDLALRISRKNGKDRPKILLKVGKTDKLIKDYLEVFEEFQKAKDF